MSYGSYVSYLNYHKIRNIVRKQYVSGSLKNWLRRFVLGVSFRFPERFLDSMVSVLEGQLSRTWYFLNQGRNHVINLYHDTITGVRSAMLDFNEIRGSTGNSSLLMDSKGHRIFFSVDSLPGYIEIKRAGWAGFAYSCVVNNQRIPEATEAVADDQSQVFKVKILGTTTTQDEMSEHLITWYIVQTTRVIDGAITTIHRRFRDFAEYNSQVKQNFKGHHLRELLPPLPEKPLKSLTDHKDPQFILDRQLKCETFLIAMLAVPHVSHMICTKAFVGLLDRVKEYSVSFHVPQLGMSLIPYNKASNKPSQHHQYDDYNTPVVVGSILKPEVCVGITPGDTISKVNGLPVAGTNFQGIIARIKLLPRPLIIHFITVIGGTGKSAGDTAADVPEAASDSQHQRQVHAMPSQNNSHNNVEAYQKEADASPLDHGPKSKKPDLFDATYHNTSSELDQPQTIYNNHAAKKPAATPVETGPSQSELTAKKQAELSEASRKALEALKIMDEDDDDLFGSGSNTAGKKKDNNKSLFGSSGGSSVARGVRQDLDEDLFAPIVPKKTSATVTPVKTPEVKKQEDVVVTVEEPVVAKADDSMPLLPPVPVVSAPEVPPAPVVEEEIAPEQTEAAPEPTPAATTIQIDPFADDFVPAEEEAPVEAKTKEPVAEATSAQPAPLGWDD